MKYPDLLFSSFLFFISILPLNAQDQDNNILVKIGTSFITAGDFRDRYEFMPHLNYSDDNPDTVKKEFLYSLIAEKLWYLQALSEGIDTINTVKYSLMTLKKLFLKDELYKKEIESKIVISPEEVSKGISFLKTEIIVNIISSEDSSEILNIYNDLKTSFPKVSSYDSSRIKSSQMKLSFGKLSDENLESVLFSSAEGDLTAPVLINNKWVIFNIISKNRDSKVFSSEEHLKNSAYTLIKERRARKLSGVYLDNIIGGKSITADKELFDIFTGKLYSELLEIEGSDDSGIIKLSERDLMRVMYKLSHQELSSPFINYVENPLTLKDFIYYLFYQELKFSSSDRMDFNSVISNAVRQFIEDELLVREAIEEGLENHPALRKDLQIWKEFYLSETLMQQFGRNINVTEAEASVFRDETQKKGSSILQVNIIEIFTNELNEISVILNKLKDGFDFSELAAEYNKREWTKKSNGMWGYFPVSAGGEIGRIAADMNIGEIYGPIKVEDGYSLLKLVDKKNIPTGLKDTISSAVIYTQLVLKKMNEIINLRTAELAMKYGAEVNSALLEQIQLSETNTFTFRLIGFGGKNAALPITIPFYEWFKELEIKEMP